MKSIRKTLSLLLALCLILCASGSALAAVPEIDYDSLTSDELEQIIADANAAHARNHEVSFSARSALSSQLKVDVIQHLPGLASNPDWRWFDWDYTREWTRLTVATEVKLSGTWLPVFAEYEDLGSGVYQLVSLTLDGQPIDDVATTLAPPRSSTPISLTALELYLAYAASESAADRLYRDQPLELTGTVASINDSLIAYTVQLSAGSGTISCEFDRGQEASVLRLVRGQEITLRGRCAGRLLTRVLLTDCTLAD